MTKVLNSLFAACMTLFVSSAGAAWVDISTTLVNELKSQGKDIPFPGGGGVAGVAVNRLNGDVYIKVQGNGIWKSTNKGANYTRVDNNTVTGRNETGFAWDQDQANPARMATFSLDGTAGGTFDGNSWKSFADIGRNWDFGSVDWVSATPSVMIATLHESGGLVHLSINGGTSWSQMNINVVASGGVDASVTAMVGVLDANTLIYCKGGGIFRSTNRGSSWNQVSPLNALTRIPKVFKGVAYLGNANGLLVSLDNGASWSQKGTTPQGGIQQGPLFGADENIMVVANQGGLYKTINAGQNWTKLPTTGVPGSFDPRWQGHYAWDPINNVVYASYMANPAYKWELGPVAVTNRAPSFSPEKGIVITGSTIRSGSPINKVEVYSSSGKLLYRQHVASVNSVVLQQLSGAVHSMQVVKISTTHDQVTKLLR